MRHRDVLGGSLARSAGAVLAVCGMVWGATLALAASPPAAAKRPVEITTHGDVRVDEFGWLRDKESPEVIEYLTAENEYTQAELSHLATLRETLYNEMLGRIKQTDLSVPEKDGGWWYLSRTEEAKAYPILCRRQGGPEGPEQVILDINALAEGHEYTRVTGSDVSPDQSMLAFLVDRTGSERCTLLVKDLETGEMLGDAVEDVGAFSLTWAADNRTLFYTRIDDANRPHELWRHTLGTPAGEDVLVYTEPDERFWLDVDRTRSDEFILLNLGSSITSEVWFLGAGDPAGEFRIVAPRRQGIEYSVDHRGDRFYILTNDSAKNFRVVEAPVSAPGAEKWRDVVPHSKDVYIEGHNCFAEHLALTERRGGYRTIRVMDLRTGAEHTIEAPETASVMSQGGNREFATRTLRFNYSSPITPASVFDYDMDTRARVLMKETEVLGGYDRTQYRVEREWATAPDGVRVPITIVHRKGIALDGSSPCLLYGYGSYGSSTEPSFSSNRLSLLDRGIVYAIAHVRGGGEMGRSWYEDGKFLHKRNTFTDFIACAERLVEMKYTNPKRLAIQGGSAGGLLIGAVVNMRPDLFAAAHAAVPFVDVVNTMLDETIPLTVLEYEEWGNPNDPVYYEYMKSYAPYENVQRARYPAMLITTGLNDPRVAYWEPAKWCARLRDRALPGTEVLLKTNMGAGHGGASGRYQRLEEQAFEYAFIVDKVGAY